MAEIDFTIEGGVLKKYNGSDTDVEIPYGVTFIGEGAFRGCESIERILFPSEFVGIEDHAFYGCKNLRCVIIPDGVTSVGSGAFGGCESLITAVVPGSVAMIGEYAFDGCPELTLRGDTGSATETYAMEARIPFADDDGFVIEGGVLRLYVGNARHVVIPAGVMEIGQDAFRFRENIRSVVIPDGVTAIGSRAFMGDTYLSYIKMPRSLMGIGDGAFSGCGWLRRVAVPDSVTVIGKGVFDDRGKYDSLILYVKKGSVAEKYANENGIASEELREEFVIENGVLKEYRGVGGDVVIPAGVTEIGEAAFAGTKGLMSVKFPEGLERIGYNAFDGCSCLTEIKLPDSVTRLCLCAFSWCSGLTEVVIPDGVTELEYGVFGYCSGLKSVTIPASVKKIDQKAFYQSNHVSIRGASGSAAEKFAKKHGIHFESVSGGESSGSFFSRLFGKK